METIICETIFHSLWQGILLAGAAGLVLLLTKDSTPALRYRLFVLCLVSFAGGMTVTLFQALSALGGTFESVSVTTSDSAAHSFFPAIGMASIQHWGTNMFQYLHSYATLIVWLWLIVVGIKSVNMALGLRMVHQMKRRQVFTTGPYWEARVALLREQFAISQPVRLVQSALAKAPMVVGHLKPMILIPIGLLNNLPAAEVEAILSHELAHIKRKDYLVNLLQSVLDILFFFNPAVLWVNKLIRHERELCCDDLALSVHTGKRDYINALLSCQSYQTYPMPYVLAFAGNKNQLLGRVSRIVNPKAPFNSGPGRAILILVTLVSIVLTALFFRPDGKGVRTIVRTSAVTNASNTTATHETVEDQPAAAAPNARPMPEKAPFTEQESQSLRQELIADKLIINPNNIAYELNDHELIVNEVKQPDAVHKRYAEKYVKYPGRSIRYNYAHSGK